MRTRSAAPSCFLSATTSVLIQSRMLLRESRARRARFRRAAGAEQHVERDARIANHRQRLVRRRPADRVDVHARVVVGAAAGLVEVLDAELHRRHRRRLAEPLRVHLIERRAGPDVRALRLLRMRLREEHRARPEVVAADFRQRRTPRPSSRRCSRRWSCSRGRARAPPSSCPAPS